MKTMQQVLTFLVVMLSMSACSKWNQDPFSGEPLAQSDGRDSTTGEKPKPGTNSDNIRIDTVSTFGFQEETEGSFTIEARMLVPEYTTVIDIPNLDEFTGASFDPATGRFAWTPAIGTVNASESLTKELVIRVIAKKPGSEDQVRTEARVMVVTRLSLAPTIESVRGPSSLREGTSGVVTVVVIDRNASEDLPATWPTLVAHRPDFSFNLAPFIDETRVTKLGSSKYQFFLKIDLSDVEVTESFDVGRADFVAYSAAGRASAAKELRLDVLTSFGDLKSTWAERIYVANGVRYEYSFAIYDPKNEVTMKDPVFKDLPAGATINCRGTSNGRGQLNCKLVWAPAADFGDKLLTVVAEVEVGNAYYGDTETKLKTVILKLETGPLISNPAISEGGL